MNNLAGGQRFHLGAAFIDLDKLNDIDISPIARPMIELLVKQQNLSV